MDTVTAVSLIFITAFVNILINVLLGTFFQKRIERSYNIEMEKYRSSLERFNFEYQTKFSRRIPKTLEVLEGIYQRYSNSEIALGKLVDSTYVFFTWDSDQKRDALLSQREFAAKFRETIQYFENNRIFISDESVKEVSVILETAKHLFALTDFDVLYTNNHISHLAAFINNLIKTYKVDGVGLDRAGKDDLYDYLLSVRTQYGKLSRLLEQHYKSVLEG